MQAKVQQKVFGPKCAEIASGDRGWHAALPELVGIDGVAAAWRRQVPVNLHRRGGVAAG